jgi:hypothetical protein
MMFFKLMISMIKFVPFYSTIFNYLGLHTKGIAHALSCTTLSSLNRQIKIYGVFLVLTQEKVKEERQI